MPTTSRTGIRPVRPPSRAGLHGQDADAQGAGRRDMQRMRGRADRIIRRRLHGSRVSPGRLSGERDGGGHDALRRLAGMVPVRTVADEAADAVRHAIGRASTNGGLRRRLNLRYASWMSGRVEELVERPAMH